MSSPLRIRLGAIAGSPGFWLAFVSIAALAMMYLDQRVVLLSGSPYEAWDELGAYHDSAVATDPIHWRAYVYGTLDTAKAALARWYYDRSDPVGRRWKIPSYSNNVPRSWASRSFDPGNRDWIDLSAIDYTYFRGVADRRPILLARELNLAVLYLLAAAVVITAAWLYGWRAVPLLLALMFCLTSWETLYGARFALPNSICAVISFFLCLLCQAAIGLARPRLLYGAAALLAVGVNHKVDFLALSLPMAIAVASVAVCLAGPARRRLAYIATVGLYFVITLVVTNPYLLIAPHLEIPRHAAVVGALQGPVRRDVNVDVLWHFLQMNFNLTPGGPDLPSRAWITASMAALVALASLPAAARKLSPLARLGIVAVVLVGVSGLFVVPVRNTSALYERYFLNGWGALLAVAGGGASIALAHVLRYRRTIVALGCVALLPCLWALGLRAAEVHKIKQVVAAELDPLTKLDKTSNRNAIALASIKLAASGGYSSTILVDQHAYFDLRALILAGLVPVYINAENYGSVIGYLPPGRYLTIFTEGDYEITPRWLGLWPEQLRAKYDAYLAALGRLEVLAEKRGSPMKLLDWKPPQSTDPATLAVLVVSGAQK